eukprot:NODE_1006_length_2292_cov_0.248518.p1 type:complete len:267 gc:universal NODE_1006_length_2292_cov_0.248518:1325-525(-)
MKDILEILQKKQLPSVEQIELTISKFKEIMLSLSNIISLQTPIQLVGDIHGQYNDLLHIFELYNSPQECSYLFMGDYVDRGYYSIHVMLTLMIYKVLYPRHVNLIRGNHESRTISSTYGFYAECQSKYPNSNIWAAFMDAFDCLPLGAEIIGESKRMFVVHGGLSPLFQELDQLRLIDRFMEIPSDGIMADIMWSDPSADAEGFSLSPRGAGYLFGKHIVERFTEINNIDHIARAHQMCMEGFQELFDDKCLTVWSAPNYSKLNLI